MRPAGVLHVTELVVVRPPEPLASFLGDRGYLPKGEPLLKRVLALPGQTVCRTDRTITVDGIAMGEALERDRRGRTLPIWRGCRALPAGDVFLMNRQSGNSLYGRYFGPLPANSIVGRAEPLWTDEGTRHDRYGARDWPPHRRQVGGISTDRWHRPVETAWISSRRCGAAALVVAAVMSSMLVADRAASVEPAPMTPREGGSTGNSFAAFIAEASQGFGVPASWIRAVMHVESVGDVRALSPKGAMGLMQIMPETWAILRARFGLGANPYDPHDNILAGAAYLRKLHDRYGAAGFLAAYDAGPARYEDRLATGRPLPAETRAYVAVLARMVAGERVDDAKIVAVTTHSWTEAPFFAVRAESRPTDSSADVRPARRQPFDRRRCGRFDGACTAIERPVRPYVPSEFEAMSGDVLHRSLWGHIAALGVEQWTQGNTNAGRQDKSAAFGRAHMVGWIELFRHRVPPP